MVYLEIDSLEALVSFMMEAKKAGMMKDISIEQMEVSLRNADWPVRIPVNLDGVLVLCRNPLVRKVFGGKIESRTKEILANIETG